MQNLFVVLGNFIAVGAVGAVGAMLRYGVTVLGTSIGWSSNLSTFLVNVIGSFVMGVLVASCEQGTWLLMATAGLCGGFTTFSTFSLQSVSLLQQGKWGSAALYIAGTLVLCIAFAGLGCFVGHKFR